MSAFRLVFRKGDAPYTYALLRRHTEFGIEELDLLRPPGRFWSDGAVAPSGAEAHVDARRAAAVPTPAELLTAVPTDSWSALTRRSLARLFSWFLVAEDPQRRLEAQAVVTLAHQASVVQHILQHPSLRRVLLADEVGLGKTVEAGLLIKQVITQNPSARVLYLAPARLVRNVRGELDRLGLGFRAWVSTSDRDATLKDPRVVASIHRACHEGRIDEVLAAPPWDMVVVDECHHLSDWAKGGGSPVAQYKLVEKLAERLGEHGRLLLMSGTPHQGHADRFRNVLRLLQTKSEQTEDVAGRVIYRTKEDVRDWNDKPLFPGRRVNSPIVIDLGPQHEAWRSAIHDFFEPGRSGVEGTSAQRRAAGWRAGQALQWATSSVQAGLGYLIRQAIRAKCTPASLPGLEDALSAIRPYRLGPANEPVAQLLARITREVSRQVDDADVEDIEDIDEEGKWRPDLKQLSVLLRAGVQLHKAAGDVKWQFLFDRILAPAGDEKVVLFAQPIETVTAVARYLERRTGQVPSLIVGGQTEGERSAQIERFLDGKGPRYLISSRAGGEGLNLQVARRLVHLDVPWNPMELEQRVGRVHRFMSKRTILVDTLVVKDSREVDTYACAREKLKTIASALVPEDRFDELFGRVMSLVPPEELQDVLGKGPVGPLTVDDQERVADFVTRGFAQWKEFHETYSQQQRQIETLDPGAAAWGDLAEFAKAYLGATPAQGFAALQFTWEAGEVVAVEQDAQVLTIGGKHFACGDYGGMPVTGDDGRRADRLASNISLVTEALRAHAFPVAPTGAAHLRWPEKEPRPHDGPFGVLIAARQSVRWEQGSYADHAATLHCATVTPDGQRTTIEGGAKGALVRTIMRSTVRREGDAAAGLVSTMQAIEATIASELRTPSEPDREARVIHAVTPLFAAVVI